MTESKIDATDRLRAEGRWEIAQLYRDKQRNRLKAEGKPRREAADESWRLMLEQFPPLDKQSFDWYYALGEYPPKLVVQQLGEDFADDWRAYCRIKAYCCYWRPGLADKDGAKAPTKERLRCEPPDEPPPQPISDSAQTVLEVAMCCDPCEFLEDFAFVLKQAIAETAGVGPDQRAARAELEACVAGLPDLLEAVRLHWPDDEHRLRYFAQSEDTRFDLFFQRTQARGGKPRVGRPSAAHLLANWAQTPQKSA